MAPLLSRVIKRLDRATGHLWGWEGNVAAARVGLTGQAVDHTFYTRRAVKPSAVSQGDTIVFETRAGLGTRQGATIRMLASVDASSLPVSGRPLSRW